MDAVGAGRRSRRPGTGAARRADVVDRGDHAAVARGQAAVRRQAPDAAAGSGSRTPRWTCSSTLRRSGPPYTLTTRELGERTLVTAGAISQRVARAEAEGLVSRAAVRPGPASGGRQPDPHGHRTIEGAVTALLTHEEGLVAGWIRATCAGSAPSWRAHRAVT